MLPSLTGEKYNAPTVSRGHPIAPNEALLAQIRHLSSKVSRRGQVLHGNSRALRLGSMTTRETINLVAPSYRPFRTAVQPVRRVRGEEELEGNKLIRKRPSGETSYWNRAKVAFG